MKQAIEPLLRELSAPDAARRLLGCELKRTFENGCIARAKIVETEAYDETDAASHSYRGRTPRTDVMFGPAGKIYVYFTYGMHYCANIVVGPEGSGAAVLIRAVEPLDGVIELEKNRPNKKEAELTNGPAKLCQALRIYKSMNGHDLNRQPLTLELNPELNESEIASDVRIGISKATEKAWRFYIINNSFISHT